MTTHGHVPPGEVRRSAEQALAWLTDGTQAWGTDAGHRRARQLAAGKALSDEDVRDMHGYFARHEKSPGEHDASGWGNHDDPSRGFAAWQGWGGDAGKKWVDGIVAKLET